MYHGTNKTAITSQDMIAEACACLLQDRPLESISVSELCKRAKVSRQTFYSLFSTKENVIIYLLIHRCPAEVSEYLDRQAPLTLSGLCHCYAIYMEHRLSFVRCIFQNGLSHLLSKAFYTGIIQSPRILFIGTDRRFDEYAARFIAGGLATIAEVYLEKENHFSRREFEALSLKLFQGYFFP